MPESLMLKRSENKESWIPVSNERRNNCFSDNQGNIPYMVERIWYEFNMQGDVSGVGLGNFQRGEGVVVSFLSSKEGPGIIPGTQHLFNV